MSTFRVPSFGKVHLSETSKIYWQSQEKSGCHLNHAGNVIETLPLDKAPEAFARMHDGWKRAFSHGVGQTQSLESRRAVERGSVVWNQETGSIWVQ